MSNIVLCKDCKHSFRPVANILTFGFNSIHTFKCRVSYKPDSVKLDPVVGSVLEKGGYQNCTIARIGHSGREDRCGEDGKFWEPKNKRDLFKFIKHVSI